MVLKKQLGRRKLLSWFGGGTMGVALLDTDAAMPKVKRRILNSVFSIILRPIPLSRELLIQFLQLGSR